MGIFHGWSKKVGGHFSCICMKVLQATCREKIIFSISTFFSHLLTSWVMCQGIWEMRYFCFHTYYPRYQIVYLNCPLASLSNMSLFGFLYNICWKIECVKSIRFVVLRKVYRCLAWRLRMKAKSPQVSNMGWIFISIECLLRCLSPLPFN